MTDNEIITALECCSVNAEWDCRSCPLLADYKTLYEDLKVEHIDTVKAIKQAKSEAVREFAEIIISQATTSIKCLPDEKVVRVSAIKEMVGDFNA